MIFNPKLKSIYKEAARIVALVSDRHDVKANATPDLKDVTPNWDYTPNGAVISGLLLPQDFERGVDAPMAGIATAGLALIVLTLAGIMAGIGSLMSFSTPTVFMVSAGVFAVLSAFIFGLTAIKAGVLAVMLSPPLALFGFLLALFYQTKPKGGHALFDATRDEVLYKQAINDGTGQYVGDFANIVRVKHKQCDAAAADTTPFIGLGNTLGYLKEVRDPYAPDVGSELGLTVADLSTHMMIMGKTGTGKTVAIKRIVRQLFNNTDIGAFVMCGKGTLPAELVGLDPNYVLLNPENSKLALFQGMTAIEVTDALAVKSEKEDAFFYASARSLVKNSAVLLKTLADAKVEGYKFTPRNLLTMMNSNGGQVDNGGYAKHGLYREKAIQAACKIEVANGKMLVNEGGMLTAAFDFFEVEFQKTQKADKTLAGVLMHANMWLEPLFTHELIAQWANCEEGEDVTECCTGKRIGLDVPAVKYGQAAASIVLNLVRQRLYSALKKRGNNWRQVEGQKAVLLLIDEMHLVWQASSGDGMDDNSMVSIARSLGGIFLTGTQSIDEMESRFSAEKTLASLGNFRNFLCYEATEKTLEYASSRVGAIYRPVNTIRNEDGEVSGLNLQAALFKEATAPADFGGRSGGGAAGVAKKMVKNTPLRFLVGVNKEGQEVDERGARASASMDANIARATYLAATPDELQIMLAEKFAAVAVLYRAGAPRREIILIEPDQQA